MAQKKQNEVLKRQNPLTSLTPQGSLGSKKAVLQHAANELIFAVVGHVGAGPGLIASFLKETLSSKTLRGGPYDVEILSARHEIESWAKANDQSVPLGDKKDLRTSEAFQDLGDEMRSATKDNSAVAKALIVAVRRARATKLGMDVSEDKPILPDGTRRAYILESLRHPDEVELLRHVYQDAFILIGVVCDTEKRLQRTMKKYKNAGEDNAKAFMKRDEKGGSRNGQRVSDAFHLADYFIDNSADRLLEDGEANKDWGILEHLSRLVKIISRNEIVRPEISETAMHDALSSSLRSACMSRQVGAALVDSEGNLIATGSNEVPRAGGGVYGEKFELNGKDKVKNENYDHRCAYRKIEGVVPYCSNTQQQNIIVKSLIEELPELREASAERQIRLPDQIKSSGVGDLLEFSRAVHAEMDALLSAGRSGVSTLGSRLFVTTYPCHYCARHIVSAGVDEVQYIEPYPKSLATKLHSDSITTNAKGWNPPSEGGHHVLFRPFVGVAPRMYRRAFLKDRELKDGLSGDLKLFEPDWGTPWHLRSLAYVGLETELAKENS